MIVIRRKLINDCLNTWVIAIMLIPIFCFALKRSVSLLKQLSNRAESLLTDSYYSVYWFMVRNKLNSSNIPDREIKIIISLTSFPGRIHLVHKTIRTIMLQKSVTPDAIELWLSKEEFPGGYEDLPSNLTELTRYGLQICWTTNNIKSYKKLIPALKKHPDDIIVTADDDVYYGHYWLNRLVLSYESYPDAIHCHKITKFYIKSGDYHIIAGGKDYYNFPSYLNKLVGVGGVLYPPHCLDIDVLSEESFLKLAPTNDDIWFWLMAVKNKTRITMCPNNNPLPVNVLNSYKTKSLSSINDKGKKLFWIQFNNILTEYPEISTLLQEEYSGIKL